MPIPEVDNAHVAEAQGLLTSRYANAAVTKGLVTAVSLRFQEIENDFWKLIGAVQLANHPMAGGPWDVLDKIGSIVGVARLGLTDPDYLALIKLQARANRSRGRAEDVISIAVAILGAGSQPYYLEMPPAAFYLGAWNIALNYPLFTRLLGQVRAAATYGVFLYTTWADGNDLEFGSTYDASAGEGGWGSVYDSTVGGLMVAAVAI